MNLSLADQILQGIAWFLAVIQFIMAFYILALNAWHAANRHVSLVILILALNNLALALFMEATDVAGATWPTYVLAITSPAIGVCSPLAIIALLQPHWLQRWRPAWWLVYGLGLLPGLVTLVDILFGPQDAVQTRLWYTGLDASTYSGGYALMAEYTAGRLSGLIRAVYNYTLPTLALPILIYIIWRGKGVSHTTRRLGWLLLGAQIAAFLLQAWLRFWLSTWLHLRLSTLMTTIATVTIFAFVYAYAAFQQMISERRLQRGSLQARLTALTLAITVPLLIAAAAFVSLRAGTLTIQSADERLAIANQALASNTWMWLNLNTRALQELASTPDIVSMDPGRQKPLLEAMAAAYPEIYLVSTTDRDGLNVARSDDLPPKDYGDRLWQIGARNGAPITFDIVEGRTSSQPALVASTPIRNESGTIIGVAMFASTVADMTKEVRAARIGKEGVAYVVDPQNRVVAHPDEAVLAELQDFDKYPPVYKLRSGKRGSLTFTDDEGRRWRAYVDKLGNEWGITVQQPEDEFLSGLARLRQITSFAIVAGTVMLASLTWLTVRQVSQPISRLTDTVTAITAGELGRRATAESEDEIGTLARAFNSMTDQLQALISGLEQRVAERTRDLERRSAYQEASAEVGRAAASILDRDQLIRQVVELIREQFQLYYVGLFLKDEAGEWAVLRAGTGEAGRAMLARGHKIKVGTGMIGWSIANAQPRVALKAGEDTVRLATAELPETRSEAAIPLRSRGQVLGALTVQSEQSGAFDEDTIAVLQTMADQVAVALDNAQLFLESQAALEAARRAYGELSQQAWAELLRTRPDWGYRYTRLGQAGSLSQAEGNWRPEMLQALQTGHTVGKGAEEGPSLAVPIKARGQVVGVLDFRKGATSKDWTAEEVALLETLAEQLGLALESAQLYRDSQRRAAREQLTGEIMARMRQSLEVERILQTAVREFGETLRAAEVNIHLMPDDKD